MKLLKSFTLFEATLWLFSVLVIIGSAYFFGSSDMMTLGASLVGVTALIYIAKGHYIGQALTILFSVLYGIISIRQTYYGEAITYLGMTAPSALFTMIAWIRHPYKSSDQVEVSRLSKRKIILIFLFTSAVTTAFYFILCALGNGELIVSTVSIATSFLAASLMFFRSPFYAIAYAANDIVLIILWSIASLSDISNVPVTACFSMFFLNDLYGFYSWQKMKKQQNNEELGMRSEE